MGLFVRDNIVSDLRNSVIEVYFTKVNGQSRSMRCTLRPDMLPPRYSAGDINEEKNYHAQNPETIACWSIDDNGWRSFRVESVDYMQDVSANY